MRPPSRYCGKPKNIREATEIINSTSNWLCLFQGVASVLPKDKHWDTFMKLHFEDWAECPSKKGYNGMGPKELEAAKICEDKLISHWNVSHKKKQNIAVLKFCQFAFLSFFLVLY